MPELPEVETIVRGLRDRILHLEFSGVEVCLDKCLRGPRRTLSEWIQGKRIWKSSAGNISSSPWAPGPVVPSGDDGQIAECPQDLRSIPTGLLRNHPHQLRGLPPVWRFSGNKKGRWTSLSRLGPEPLEISPSEFVSRVRSRRREIKPLLLDQHFLAGVGNIYADESLHRAGIHPRRKSDSLGARTLSRLHQALQEILKESIRAGGTSVRSYVDSAGALGAFQHGLRVYGREGESCQTCGRTIVRERVGGRSSFYCRRCQRGPSPKRS
jgi:formamidopyrimidine-DNA glycosylase